MIDCGDLRENGYVKFLSRLTKPQSAIVKRRETTQNYSCWLAHSGSFRAAHDGVRWYTSEWPPNLRLNQTNTK